MKVDILQYLTDDDIKTLIPKIGAQISFRKKLKDFLNRENNVRKCIIYIYIYTIIF